MICPPHARIQVWSLLLLMLLATGSPIGADTDEASQTWVQAWKERLEAIDLLLLDAKYDKAYKESSRLLQTMTDRIVEGDGAFPLMAAASILRAVAESGRGNSQDARWDLHLAQAFRAEVGNFDFSRYGEIGASLAGTDPARRRSDLKRWDDVDVKPPKKTKMVNPEFPDAMSAACLEGIVIMSMIVDTNGVPSDPHVMHSDGGPVMAYAALEAIRQWRFKPARYDGIPVDIFSVLTTSFRREGCPKS